MIAYEFYWVDKRRESHFFAILPERRKNSDRITKESIMKWGKMVISDNKKAEKFYFSRVEVPEKSNK
jgi:hypothetical protein